MSLIIIGCIAGSVLGLVFCIFMDKVGDDDLGDW